MVRIGWFYIRAEFHDCLFKNNDRTALLTYFNGDVKIVRTTFLENTGSDGQYFPYGAAIVMQPGLTTSQVSISDSAFIRNNGHAGGSGGALSFAVGRLLLTNVSFLANTAQNSGGGGAFDIQGGAL